MPEEAFWESFFDPEKILRTFGLEKISGDVVEFGCGYGRPLDASPMLPTEAEGATGGGAEPGLGFSLATCGKGGKMRLRSLMSCAVLFSFAVLFSACATTGTPARPAPDFSIKLLDGGDAAMSRFKGRPLMICVGATWCPHCLHEAPIFKKVHEKYGDRLGMLGVLIKSKQKDAEVLVRKEGLGFPMGLDDDGSFSAAYGIKGLPAILFIDSSGMIVDENVGGLEEDEMVELVEKLLAPPPVPAVK